VESDVIIKANIKEMENFSEESSVDYVHVKSYEMVEDNFLDVNTFEVRLRHIELARELRGEFTIPGVLKRIRAAKRSDDE